jgi:hypothetical protein
MSIKTQGYYNKNCNIVNQNYGTVTMNVYNNHSLPLVSYLDTCDMNHFMVNELLTLMTLNPNPFLSFFELYHCNINRPMYHNIYYNECMGDYIYVYANSKWVQSERDEALDKIISICVIDYKKICNWISTFACKKVISKLLNCLRVLEKGKDSIEYEIILTGVKSILIESSPLIEYQLRYTNTP